MENEIITADLKAEKLIRKFGLLSTEVVKEIISVSIKESSEEESLYWAEVEQHLLNKLELARPEHEEIIVKKPSPFGYDILDKVEQVIYEGYLKGINYDVLILSKELYKEFNGLKNYATMGGLIIKIKESCSVSEARSFLYDSLKVETKNVPFSDIKNHQKLILDEGWIVEVKL